MKVATATTGTGTLSLGAAVAGFRGTASLTDGALYSYSIEEGTNRETGQGTYTASGATLTRSVDASTNSDAAISLSGAAVVSISVLSRDLDGKAPKLSPTLTAADAGSVGLTVKGAFGQTANLQECANWSGSTKFAVGPTGKIALAGSAVSDSYLIRAGDSDRVDSTTTAIGIGISAINQQSGDIVGGKFTAEIPLHRRAWQHFGFDHICRSERVLAHHKSDARTAYKLAQHDFGVGDNRSRRLHRQPGSPAWVPAMRSTLLAPMILAISRDMLALVRRQVLNRF